MINSAKNIQWQGETILGGALKKGMTLDDAFKIVDKLMDLLFANQDLTCLDLSDFGITCPPEDKGKVLCLVLGSLLNSQAALGSRLAQINQFLTSVQQLASSLKDERVSASSASTQSKFLIDAISGTPGRVVYDVTSDTVQISGLVMRGARMFVNPNRLPDFDNNGKGKVGTDVVGWAIRDGRNGLDNALNRLPMYTDTLPNAGQKAGAKEIVIDPANMKTISFVINGTIDDALVNPVTVEVPYMAVNKHFGVGASRDVTVPDDTGVTGYKLSKPVNLRHTHAVNLTATKTNPQPTPISIIPEHIKEIPIEFIGL